MLRKTVEIPLQVAKLLKIFCKEVKAVFNGKFLALYVFGSVAMGDFSEHSSDIDFLVLVATPINHVEGKQLQALHDKLCVTQIGDRLEGEYVVTSTLCPEGVKGTIVRCKDGVLLLDVPSKLSAENILDIRQNAIVVYGPNPKNIMPHVSRRSVQKAMQEYLREEIDELKCGGVKDLKWLSSGVLNTCRTLYTLKTGRITSKSVGARWALRVLSPEWKPLIRRSVAVRQGNHKENDKTFIAATLPRFVAYALKSSKYTELAKEQE